VAFGWQDCKKKALSHPKDGVKAISGRLIRFNGESLFFYIQATRLGVDLPFFGQLVKGIAQLPGIEICLLLQLRNANTLFRSFDDVIY